MSRQSNRAIFAAMMMILASLAGCLGGEDLNDGGTVMVSTYHVEQIVSAVGGDLVEVEMMSTSNVPVHDYEPSAEDLIRLQSADLFFYHGLGLEPWVESTLTSMGSDAPLATSTHALPSGEVDLDYESLMVAKLCGFLNAPSTTDVHMLAEHDDDAGELHGDEGAYNMAFPEHDHDEEDDGAEGEHDHDEEGEHDHEDHRQLKAEETIEHPDGCPTGTVISVYHFEEGEYMFEFEAEEMETFQMAMAQMGGAHHHHHEEGVCHDTTTHENHDEYEDEDACEAAGHMWMEGEQEGEGGACHDEDTHENHDEYKDEESCEAAGHHWNDGDNREESEAEHILERFDADNDSSLSLDEFKEAMESMEKEHDHDEEGNETGSGNETEEEHDAAHELEMAMSEYFFNQADADNNSLLSLSELEEVEHMMEDDDVDFESMIQVYMSVFDEDANGSLSIGEFTEMMEVMMAMDHEEHEEDANGTEEENMTAKVEMMFTALDANENGSIDVQELTGLTEMMEEHEEVVGFIHVHVEEEGEYGIALPAGVSLHVLMEGDHEGHDHGEDREGSDDDHDDEDGHDDDDDDHRDEDDHDDHGDEEALAYDPHSWLDPLAFKEQVEVVVAVMSTAFPDGADTFRANADAFLAELDALDEGFEAAFGENGTCSNNTVVSNHNAYAYMAQRYDLEFVTVHGLDPEGEPSAEDIAEVVERIAEDDLTVLFVEEYTDENSLKSLVQQTVSDELPEGIELLKLYTMELAPMDSSDDYVSLMNKNLENLKTGLGC